MSSTRRPSESYGIEPGLPVADHDTVTLASGSTFLIVSRGGAVMPGGVQGFYADDTRLIDHLLLRVDHAVPRVLRTSSGDRTLCVVSVVGDATKPHIMVTQTFEVTSELTLVVQVENLTSVPREVSLDLTVTADFADLFDVKRAVRPRGGMITHGAVDDDLVVRYIHQGFSRGVRVHIDSPDEVLRDGIHLMLHLPGHGTVTTTATATPNRPTRRRLLRGADEPDIFDRWRAGVTQPPEARLVPLHVWRRSWEDLGMLLMEDPLSPGRMMVAAGSPWFMALFGRDSLITSMQTLPYRSDLAMGVLAALADRQGRRHDPVTLEEPGKIPHEVRRGEVVQRADGWGTVFYGTVDATPLFVMALAEAHRRGAPPAQVAELLPHAVDAAAWMTGFGDLDGDGFVEYPGEVHGAAGLENQGWKDSDDAIRHADGRVARGPIATVEVQGYCHAALLALADLQDAFGTGQSDELRERAERLRQAIDQHFWMEDQDCYALALDGDKRPVASVSSNAGHLLFTGTARGERAERLARRLMEPDVFTGFGLRTLSSANPGYNPLSYHCGSVWPHDTALVAAGLLRVDPARGHRLAMALLDAADHHGRLPELFGGFDRHLHPSPVPYPTSCSPQAWAAGAPLLLASRLGPAP